MKKVIFVLIVLASGIASAQKTEFKYLYSNLNYSIYPWYGDKKQESLIKNKVESVTLFREIYSKKGKLKSKKINSIINFNALGKPDIFKKFRGKKPMTYTYTYNDNNYITSEIQVNSKGKILKKIEKSFYSKIQYKEIKTYKKGGTEVKERVDYKVEDDLLLQTDYYKKNKLSQSWKYEYSPDKKLSKTTLFNKKGKVLYIWLHDCRPEGELTTMKNKDTALVCRKVEINPDGSYTKTIINTQNNKIITQVMTFSSDSILLTNTGFNIEGIMIYKMIANNKYNNSYQYYAYHSKTGILQSSSENTYNDAGFPLVEKYSFFNRNGKLQFSNINEYSYNEKELPVKVVHTYRNNKRSCDIYEYTLIK